MSNIRPTFFTNTNLSASKVTVIPLLQPSRLEAVRSHESGGQMNSCSRHYIISPSEAHVYRTVNQALTNHHAQKLRDRPTKSSCVPRQEPPHSDGRLQPRSVNEHFGKANMCIQHQHFLITVVSCGIFC